MNKNNHRIAYAFYKEEWVYGRDDNGALAQEGTQVTPEEFDPDMKGNIFCPSCFTPLSRSPNIASVTTNSRVAHFKHKPTYSEIPCILKTKKKEGLSYENEEEALKAIENERLVIVHDWMNEPPLIDDNTDKNREFNQTAIEDESGAKTEVAIGRHNGKEIKLPSKISSVAGLCRCFDENLHKGYYFPSSIYPRLLSDMLFDVNRITKRTSNKERLFFGKITGYNVLDFRNVILIRIKAFQEFKIYTYPEFDERRRIGRKSVGRYILFYSSLEWERKNIPRCFINKWGQYSLLPQSYEKYLLKYRQKLI